MMQDIFSRYKKEVPQAKKMILRTDKIKAHDTTMILSKNITWTIMLSAFTVLLVIVASLSVSATMMALLTLGIGHMIRYFLFKGRTEDMYAGHLFNVVFSVYTILAVIYYLSFFYAPDTLMDDQRHFYEASETWSKYSFGTIIYHCSHTEHLTHPLYIWYIASLARIANIFLDGNNILLQLLASVNVGAFSSLLIFKLMLNFNIDKRNAFKYTLLFVFLSEFGFYSVQMLRDIHIAFFYLCGFLIISKPFSLYRFIALVLLAVMIWFLRVGHGIFFVLFIVSYIYINLVKNKNLLKNVFALLFLGACLWSISKSSDSVGNVLKSSSEFLDYYENLSINSARNNTSNMGTILKIRSLPSPIKEICLFFFMEIQPFPFWVYLNSDRYTNTTLQYIFNLRTALIVFFWFPLMSSLLYWMVVKKRYKQMSLNLIGLLVLSIALVVNASSEIASRRCLCVYPVFLLTYVVIRTKYVSDTGKNTPFRIGVLFVIFAHFLYVLIKNIS